MIENRLTETECNKTIRRYMDYPKFLSLILNKALYFASPHEFEDKQDSLIPDYTSSISEIKEKAIKPEIKLLAEEVIKAIKIKINLELYSKKTFNLDFYFLFYIVSDTICLILLKENKNCFFKYSNLRKICEEISQYILNNDWHNATKEIENIFEKHLDCILLSKKFFKDTSIISCWNITNDESDLLWKTYGNNGLAIETTTSKLEKALIVEDTLECCIDKIEYIDLQETIEKFNKLTLDEISKDTELQRTNKFAFTKRKCFKGEEELRILIRNRSRYNGDCNKKGELISLDSSLDFIDKIIISPYDKNINVDIVKKLLSELGLDLLSKKVEKSGMI